MKMNKRYLIDKITLTIFIIFVLPRCASAYLDPGTGSYFFQLIIAALLGGLFAVRLFWDKIKILFNFKKFFFKKEKHDRGQD